MKGIVVRGKVEDGVFYEQYKPSKNEEALLLALDQAPFENDLDWASKAGVEVTSLKRAKKKIGFVKMYTDALFARSIGKAPGVIDRSIEAALEDSFRDREMMLRYWGLYNPSERHELTGEGGGAIRVSLADIVRQMSAPEADVTITDITNQSQEGDADTPALPEPQEDDALSPED